MEFANHNSASTVDSAPVHNTSDDGRRKVQQYENLATIGQGASSSNLVRRKEDGLALVIKKVKVGMMTDKERTDALQEVSILSKLQHPHVIAYHEAFLNEGSLNIVLDYADGDSRGPNKKCKEKRPIFLRRKGSMLVYANCDGSRYVIN